MSDQTPFFRILLSVTCAYALAAAAGPLAAGEPPAAAEGMTAAAPAAPAAPASAQETVAAALREPGVTVVHFWAPWCPNCLAELKGGGWTEFARNHPQTRFYFVALWNGGEDGRAALTKFGLAGEPNVTVLADPNPSRDADAKTKAFLGLPLSWIPSTWVFKRGHLYYALNYGEVHFPVLQQLVADADANWSHP